MQSILQKLCAIWPKGLILIIGLLLLLDNYVAGELKNPLKNPYICGRPECESEYSKFAYELQNVRYKYDYQMHLKTEFAGSGENISELYLTAAVILTFPKPCEGVLKLDEIEVRNKAPAPPTEESESDNEFSFDYTEYGQTEDDDIHKMSDIIGNNLKQNDLRFAFHNGLVQEVCPNSDEQTWVLNFKKGIMSSLQNTMLRFDIDLKTTEIDVSGICDVTYSLVGSKDTSLVIQKNKDISSCSHRYKAKTVLQTVPYDFRQNQAVYPILQSESYCNQTIDHNIYQSVDCYERHQLAPFSNNHTGAVTTLTFRLNLADEERLDGGYDDYSSSVDPNSKVEIRSTLLFDHKGSPKPTQGEIKASRDFLKKMCELGSPNIKREFIDTFSKFLHAARILSYSALQQLLNRADGICDNKNIGKNHVLESLPYIGSVASVMLMKDQIINNAIPKEVVSKWLGTISFIPRPEEEMLDSFYQLIKHGKTQKMPEYILSSTAVVHSYCRINSDCGNNEIVIKIMKYLETEILDSLKRDIKKREVQERLIILLKGIGNIGVLTNSMKMKIKQLIENGSIPVEIRLQAISSHRRFDCLISKEYFLNIYRNFTEQPEIRIGAYLQSMRCPDYQSIKLIKYVLKTEQVNQVGSFVWSHLTNIAKSASPVRVAAQGLLIDGELSNKYKLDIRKFSRNFEYSLFFDEYNFGATTDMNIIFGTESYIPRVALFNFTLDLFGESVNLFEISARIQGFEQYIESIFGPKGPINTERFKEKYNAFMSLFPSSSSEEEYWDKSNNRIRRDASSESDEEEELPDSLEMDSKMLNDQASTKPAATLKQALSTDVKNLGYNLKYKYTQPKAAFGFKMFGNDLKFITMEGMLEILDALNNLSPMALMKKFFSGNEFNYSKTAIFLDASYEVPLSAGLPLAIHGHGASSIDFRIGGILKTPDFLKTNYLDIEGKLKPSVALDITATMQIDFYHTTTGIRVKNNLYSSSTVQAKLKVNQTNLMSLQISLPQDRSDIFSARSELLVLQHETEIVQNGISTRYANSTCTWPILNNAIGLKVCADYSLPDISNSSNVYPSLWLSGPVNLDIHMDKADLTAKTFSFEFLWTGQNGSSKGSFIFETPGTAIKRILSTKFSLAPEISTLNMDFVNGNRSHSAVATYLNHKRDTSHMRKLEAYLNLSGQKNIALEAEISRIDVKTTGSVVYPKFILSIQQERVVGLAGSIRVTNKKEILQYDVNLDFETKRLKAKFFGNIVKNPSTYRTKLTSDYQFFDAQDERVELEAEFTDRSQKSRLEYQGFTKLKTSAYPKINFHSTLKYLAVLGHMEARIDINNSPDFLDPNYNLMLRFIFARLHMEEKRLDGSRTTVSLEVKRPVSNVDFKVMVKHKDNFRKGLEHSVFTLLRYAPEKEATGVFSILFARGTLFGIDAAMNITVPSFDSCAAAIRIFEKTRKSYDIDFKGTWFTGDSIKVNGIYQDKSSVVKKYHHIKIIVQSPQFEDAHGELKYWVDQSEAVFDLQTDYAKNPYAIVIKTAIKSEYERLSYAELKFMDKIYSISANMHSQEPKQLFVEVHIDKIRDLHLILRGLSNDYKKEVGVEIKWDANRDPTQKLAVSLEFNNPHFRQYDGGFIVTYPERTFSGTFETYLAGPTYHGFAKVGWSTFESIDIQFNAGTHMTDARDAWASIKINTPFDSWRNNAFNCGIYVVNKLVLTNASITWADNQNLAYATKTDYEINDPLLRVEVLLNINSTIKDVPSLYASIKHRHDDSSLNSDLYIKHEPAGEIASILSLKSDWDLINTDIARKMTGIVVMTSPFEGYKSGALSTKFSWNDFKEIEGAGELVLENKKYTLTLDGRVLKFTDSYLSLNITTPLEKFRSIKGQFGISEKDKHVIAELRTPNSALGIELLFQLIKLSEFDIKFSIETPLEALERILAVAKMNPETVHLRGGWNAIDLGFIGVWRWVNFSDFEYSYRLFTPLEKYRQLGLVAKLIYSKVVDLEFSLQAADMKLGIKTLAEPKPLLLRKLPMVYPPGFPPIDPEEESEYNLDEFQTFVGDIELDTWVWPTIYGKFDYEERGDYYSTNGILELPIGNIEAKNMFYFPDYMHMKNLFQLSTPLVYVRKIESNFDLSIELFQEHLFAIDLLYLNGTQWIESGIGVNYTKLIDDGVESFDASLILRTPLKNLPRAEFHSYLETEESIYRGNFSIKAGVTQLRFSGSLESEDNYLDTSFGLSLYTPLVPQYECKVFFKKNYPATTNTFALGFEVNDNKNISSLNLEGEWIMGNNRIFEGHVQLNNNLLPVPYVKSRAFLARYPSSKATIELLFGKNSREYQTLKVDASRKNEQVTVEVVTPLENYQNITLQGTLSARSPNSHNYLIRGNLYRNLEVYNVEGTVILDPNNIPTSVNTTLKPLSKGTFGQMQLSVNPKATGDGNNYMISITEGEKFVHLNGSYEFASKENWNVNLNIASSVSEISEVNLFAGLETKSDKRIQGQITATTPWRNQGLDSINLLGDILLNPTSGDIEGSYKFPLIEGTTSCSWSWIIMEDMQILLENTVKKMNETPKYFLSKLKYLNTDKAKMPRKILAESEVNLHNIWQYNIDSTIVMLSRDDVAANLNAKLPEPVGDTHHISGRYRGNLANMKGNLNIDVDAKYDADDSNSHYATRILYRNETNTDGLFKVEWGHDLRKDTIDSGFKLTRLGNRRELSGRLATPLHLEDSLTVNGIYDKEGVFHKISGKLSYPASVQLAMGDVAIATMSNMYGVINCSTPFSNVSWIKGDFEFKSDASEYKRFIDIDWPSDSALFHLKSSFDVDEQKNLTQGVIDVELPLATRHYGVIKYELKELHSNTTGFATINYNKENVVRGDYSCVSVNKKDFNQDIIDITLENKWKPIGIHYTHSNENLLSPNESNLDKKHLELFYLKNRSALNLTGEFNVRTTATGYDYKVTAIHTNRTVSLASLYDFTEDTTLQKSILTLAPTVWIAYELKLQNLTTPTNETQNFLLELSYPKRNLTSEGWYVLTKDQLDSDLSFRWTKNLLKPDENEEKEETYNSDENENESDDNDRPRVVRMALKWHKLPTEKTSDVNQSLSIILRHPSFEKDMTLTGYYYNEPLNYLNTKVELDYCGAPSHLFTLGFEGRDMYPLLGYRNYTYKLKGNHEVSDFFMDAMASVGWRSGLYETINSALYKRGYLPLQTGALTGKINLNEKEIDFFKETTYKVVSFWAKTDGSFPLYTLNATAVDSPDINATAEFYLNFDNKLIRLDVNMTPEAIQRIQMYGHVADSRSAYFDLWRNYDDIRVEDITYYIKMNHSRLVTSKLIWRPKLKSDIKEKFRETTKSIYDSISETLDFWIKTIYIETMDTINDVWVQAKPYTQVFLTDVGGLRVLENDIEDFQKFLNRSYEANDFYFKTVINFTSTVLDDLAIKNQIESLPKIVSEIWQVMGYSGQALKKSITWLIETVKNSYNRAVEILSKILHGESLTQLSSLMEGSVAKYDKFIKDLHVSLIKYVETMWNRITDMISNYWKRSLQRIEPSIIKFAHYIETFVWNVSKEIFDFLYKRTNELVESPYFNQVSNFTQDLDRLYKDLMANDAITNIKKYSVLTIHFLKEQYFKVVPFGKELHEVLMEIYEEIKTLKELEPVQLFLQKAAEVQSKLDWIANEFQIENRMQNLWLMLKSKVAKFTQTALQADDHYREAKTNFIFDPHTGIMQLEQKLPMSWHAFNETPRFEEIPEYKLLMKVQEFFAGSNFSIWNLYYEYKPYTDPHSWLPPFKAHALMIGSRHYMTFDNTYVSLNQKYVKLDVDQMNKPDQCSYVLVHDFLDGNFTILVEPTIFSYKREMIAARKYTFITDNQVLDFDLAEQTVRLNRDKSTSLPVQVGDTVVYRDADTLILESEKGVAMHCNLQFDICWLQVSGWYFGKTAGILGTINNEQYDELTTSSQKVALTDTEFTNSWSLRNCRNQQPRTHITPSTPVLTICDSFFKAKTSYFYNCFSTVDPNPFYDMCLDMGMNSISLILNEEHPAQKGACTAALAYIEACTIQKIPLRVPDACIHCNLINGSYVAEGTFVELNGKDVPRTTDVVFIVEAKPCNKNLTFNKQIMSVVSALEKEFNNLGLKMNRYAVVTYGGVPPFDKPRSIVYNKLIFNNAVDIEHHFKHIKTGAGSMNDTFEALSVASKLIFRPGASKTFILMPCGPCNASNMRLDYSSILQALLEENIKVHVLMNDIFSAEKNRMHRTIFGIDHNHSYTKRYLKDEVQMKRQISLPKAELAQCAPLAIETNATIFTSTKLEPSRKGPIKKFSQVFAKRVAISAEPSSCQICECTGHNNGISYMICTQCELPYPQSEDDFGDEIEVEEEDFNDEMMDPMWDEDEGVLD